jgi:hypothetical protein
VVFLFEVVYFNESFKAGLQFLPAFGCSFVKEQSGRKILIGKTAMAFFISNNENVAYKTETFIKNVQIKTKIFSLFGFPKSAKNKNG